MILDHLTPRSTTEWIRFHLLTQGTDPPAVPVVWTTEEVARAVRTRLSAHFFNLQRTAIPHLQLDPALDEARIARLRMGALRYESLGRPQWDVTGSARRRLSEYPWDHNLEHLVDALNLIDIEWLTPSAMGTYYLALPGHSPHMQQHLDPYMRAHVALVRYQRTGNRAHLVLAAGLLRVEWRSPSFADARLRCTVESTHCEYI